MVSPTSIGQGDGGTDAAQGSDDDEAPAASARRGRFEIKRQSTARGTPSESTKTTLRLEVQPEDGLLSLVRLDVPFPDDKDSFEGNLLAPRLGDIKFRFARRAVRWGGVPVVPFVELIVPTADPAALGSGKLQIAPALRTSRQMRLDTDSRIPQAVVWGGLVQQFVSVGGAPSREDIDYTKLELSVMGVWREERTLKLTVKPVIDWEQDGKTGAVAELEGSVDLSADWRTTLMVGTRLRGPGTPGTYSKRVELSLYRF